MELGLSTATIARQLTEAGIPTAPQTVSSWESPTSAFRPLEHRIDALAEILGVTRTDVERWFGVEIVPGGSHAE
jgi:transcriptional regulator with XRE-family HTH domain